MNYKAFPIGIHVNENSVKMLTGIVQNDNANLFQIQLYDGTAAFDFSGYTVLNATILRPDGTQISDVWPVNEGSEETESHTFLAIQRIDPENGKLTLKVGGYATAQVGLHRMALEIYDGDARLTTARINYSVVESLNNDETILDTQENYVALQSILSACAQILEQEDTRVSEEAAREETYTDLYNRFMIILNEAEALSQHLAGGDFAAIVEALSSELETTYLPISSYHQPYIVAASEPEDTNSLWIDSATGNMHYYDTNAGWLPVKSVAVFG